MDEFSDGKAIFLEPQNVVWSRVDSPNKWEIQEPYGYFQYSIQLDAWVQNREKNIGTAFYTAPPQREWVGLTDDEIRSICNESYVMLGAYAVDFMKAIEAKLKEKNHVS